MKANQLKGIQHVREITARLHTWASDHGGYYPDHGKTLTSLTSNEVFRELVRHDPTMDEAIFGCPNSRFMPDKNIGVGPHYDQALLAGENHWAMSAGLNQIKTPGRFPLIFENPVDTTWPPRWLVGAERKPVPGRANFGGQVIVSFNDGGVELVKLHETGDRMHFPNFLLELDKKSPLPAQKILNIIVYGNSYTGPGIGGVPPETSASGLQGHPGLPAHLDPQKSGDPP